MLRGLGGKGHRTCQTHRRCGQAHSQHGSEVTRLLEEVEVGVACPITLRQFRTMNVELAEELRDFLSEVGVHISCSQRFVRVGKCRTAIARQDEAVDC